MFLPSLPRVFVLGLPAPCPLPQAAPQCALPTSTLLPGLYSRTHPAVNNNTSLELKEQTFQYFQLKIIQFTYLFNRYTLNSLYKPGLQIIYYIYILETMVTMIKLDRTSVVMAGIAWWKNKEQISRENYPGKLCRHRRDRDKQCT